MEKTGRSCVLMSAPSRTSSTAEAKRRAPWAMGDGVFIKKNEQKSILVLEINIKLIYNEPEKVEVSEDDSRD